MTAASRRGSKASRCATCRAIISRSARPSAPISRPSTSCCCARTRPSTWATSPRPSARAHPSEDAGGQRPGPCAQCAGEDLRHRISATNAADALITRDARGDPGDFRRAHGDIILKPLYGNGGAGVFRLSEGDQNLALAARDLRRPPSGAALCRAALPAGRAAPATSASSSSTASPWAPSTACRPMAIAFQHACRRPPGADRADPARPRDLRGDRPGI